MSGWVWAAVRWGVDRSVVAVVVRCDEPLVGGVRIAEVGADSTASFGVLLGAPEYAMCACSGGARIALSGATRTVHRPRLTVIRFCRTPM